ncbi:hypothetical protein HYR54_15565 [Candidatus Acetothermia bacterium]|nr:hypothetical protein [Candidatus Acetothermia bacterium]
MITDQTSATVGNQAQDQNLQPPAWMRVGGWCIECQPEEAKQALLIEAFRVIGRYWQPGDGDNPEMAWVWVSLDRIDQGWDQLGYEDLRQALRRLLKGIKRCNGASRTISGPTPKDPINCGTK